MHQHRSMGKQCGGKGNDVGELDSGGGGAGFRLRHSFLSLVAVKGVIKRMSERAGSFHLGLGGPDWSGNRHNSYSPNIL